MTLQRQRIEDIFTGIPIIDGGHRELLNRLANLRAAIKAQICRYTVEDTVAFLDEYVEVNLSKEEQYMNLYKYPDLAFHKARHGEFTAEVGFLGEELRSIKALGLRGSYELSVETIRLITDWIDEHIISEELTLAEFIKKRQHKDDDVILSGRRLKYTADGANLTICYICKKILCEKGGWKERKHFSSLPKDCSYTRGLCPGCLQERYADMFIEKR